MKMALWAIFDILVDQARDRLWVTSASMPGFSRYDPIDKGRSALFEFNLDTLELIHRYPVPVDGQSHILGSMVLSPNGDIFIADRSLPLIYSKTAGEQKIKPVLALREMISQRGIAMQPDGRILYVADREMGIMVIDLEARQARLLQVPDTLNLGGIDGLVPEGQPAFCHSERHQATTCHASSTRCERHKGRICAARWQSHSLNLTSPVLGRSKEKTCTILPTASVWVSQDHKNLLPF